MTKFFQITINGKLHAINTDNVAMVKQIDANLTEIHLFSKNENEQIIFKVAYNYMNFIKALDDKDEFSIDFVLNEFQE